MVSSTFEELKEHRKAVIDAILGQRMLPLAMEHDTAIPGMDVTEASLHKVDEADAYVGLISYRPGQVLKSPLNPEQLPLTHLEFQHASGKKKIPRWLFVMDKSHPWPIGAVRVTKAEQRKLDAFIREAKAELVYATFRSVDDLKAKVVQALSNLPRIIEGQKPKEETEGAGKGQDPATASVNTNEAPTANPIDNSMTPPLMIPAPPEVDLPASEYSRATLLYSAALECRDNGVINSFEQNSRIKEHAYAVKWRIKRDIDILDKVRRNKPSDSTFGVDSVTDVMGFRCVTDSRAHSLRILEVLCDLLSDVRDERTGRMPLFLPGSVHEATIHLNNERTDIFGATERAKAIIETRFPHLTCKIGKSAAYSSIHLHAKLPSPGTGKPDVPVEIQIRTIYEEAWNTADHPLYRARRETQRKPPPDPGTAVEIALLKQLLDACMVIADKLHRTGIEGGAPPAIGDVKRTLGDGEQPYYIDLFRDRSVPEPIIAGVEKLIREKDELDRQAAGVGPYSANADKLHDLYEDLSKLGYLGEKSPGPAAVRWVLMMEEAIGRFFARDFDSALERYDALSAEPAYNRCVALHFRQGLALLSVGKNLKALDALSKAEGLFIELVALPPEKRRLELPEQHVPYLRGALPHRKGFAIWRNSIETRDPATRLDQIRDAYLETRRSLGIPQLDDGQRLYALNNLVFFASEYVEWRDKNASVVSGAHAITREAVKDHLDEFMTILERRFGPDIKNAGAHLVDTLGFANFVLKNADAARKYAKLAYHALEQQEDQIRDPVAVASYRRMHERQLHILANS